jgi:hypothetical protein
MELHLEKGIFSNFLDILDSIIEKLNFKLIFVFFPDEFTSLEKISDNGCSSRSQYPIEFIEKML